MALMDPTIDLVYTTVMEELFFNQTNLTRDIRIYLDTQVTLEVFGIIVGANFSAREANCQPPT